MMKEIQIISLTDEQGSITPIKFRLLNENEEYSTHRIESVQYVKEQILAGIPAIAFGCIVHMEERERFIEIKYLINEHRWILFRIIN